MSMDSEGSAGGRKEKGSERADAGGHLRRRDSTIRLLSRNLSNAFTETNITLVVSILTLLSTVILQTWYTIVTQNSHYVSTFNALHTEYASPEMLDAFDVVEDFIIEHGVEHYTDVFMSLKKNKKRKEVSKIDHARRRVVHWYGKTCLFWKKGLIPADLLMSFPGERKAKYFLRNFEPLEEANRMIYGANLDVEVFRCLRELYSIEETKPGMCSDDSLGEAHALCPATAAASAG